MTGPRPRQAARHVNGLSLTIGGMTLTNWQDEPAVTYAAFLSITVPDQ